MAVQTVGSALKVDRSPAARRLSLALYNYVHTAQQSARVYGSTMALLYTGNPDMHVFTQASGAPTANESTESPGCNICIIKTMTAGSEDLWMVYDWVSASSFKVAQILNTVT